MSRALINLNKPAVFSVNQKQNLTRRAHTFPRLATVAYFSALISEAIGNLSKHDGDG